jgi:hypothetical protein
MYIKDFELKKKCFHSLILFAQFSMGQIKEVICNKGGHVHVPVSKG